MNRHCSTRRCSAYSCCFYYGPSTSLITGSGASILKRLSVPDSGLWRTMPGRIRTVSSTTKYSRSHASSHNGGSTYLGSSLCDSRAVHAFCLSFREYHTRTAGCPNTVPCSNTRIASPTHFVKQRAGDEIRRLIAYDCRPRCLSANMISNSKASRT